MTLISELLFQLVEARRPIVERGLMKQIKGTIQKKFRGRGLFIELLAADLSQSFVLPTHPAAVYGAHHALFGGLPAAHKITGNKRVNIPCEEIFIALIGSFRFQRVGYGQYERTFAGNPGAGTDILHKLSYLVHERITLSAGCSP